MTIHRELNSASRSVVPVRHWQVTENHGGDTDSGSLYSHPLVVVPVILYLLPYDVLLKYFTPLIPYPVIRKEKPTTMPAHEDIPLDPRHELTKSFLFLRTADAAVTNSYHQERSTWARMMHAVRANDDILHLRLIDELADEEKELQKWKDRLVDGQIGFVDWAARCAIGRGLPTEILWLFRDVFEATQYAKDV